MKIIVFSILFSLSTGFCLAQQHFSASGLLSQSAVSQWTGENGLISNNITSAIRDRTGFVWITSYNGVMRFDGIQVYVFDEDKIPFVSTGAFYSVYEDKDGTLWFSSQNNGVIFYRDGKFEQLDPENKILPKSIRSLLVCDDGTIWAGSNNSGLYKIVGNAITHVESTELDETSILEMALDSKHNLWIATDGEGLYKYDGKKFENIAGISNRIVNSIFVTKDDHVLIGTPSGLDIYKDKKLSSFSQLKLFQVNKIICDKYDRVWIGTEFGLARFNLDDEKSFSYVGERDGFPLSRINSLHFDEENSLWVSTARAGLVQLRESNIVNISLKQGLEQDKINMIYEGTNRTFYIGSDGGAVDIYKQGEVTPLKIETPLFDSGIRDIYIDGDGNLWIASYRGLLKKTKNSERLYGLKEGMTTIDLRRILPADNGDLWIASRSGGLMKLSNGKIIEKYDKDHLLESNYILALEKDASGNIYMGTHSGGMSILRTDGTVQTFHIEKNDAGIVIFNIHIDDQSRVWAICSQGIFYFNGKGFQKIQLVKTIKGEVFFDWIEDKLGNAWITSNVGVLKILKSDVEKFLKKEISEVNFKLFDNRDGMKAKECTAATRSMISSSGKIWVPTVGGISVFYPEKTIENKIPPPVFITALVTDNHEENGIGPLIIKPGNLRYKFVYTAPSFISPRKIQFKYKLDGIDDSWINAGAKRDAEYTNLAPGDYTFRVLACNNDGVWNETGAALKITVKPFFYQTALFYVLLILLAGSIFYGIYKWRVNEIERRNTELSKVNGELDRFVYSASHDLRAPLASVLGLVNVARLDGKNFDDYLNKIELSVLRLDGFIRDIIDFSRNARVELDAAPVDFNLLISEIFENLRYLDEKDSIKRLIKVEPDGIFYSDKKRLTVVLNNLISNAIKYSNPHSTNSFIEVSVKHNAKQAVLQVKDNGIGIAPQHISNIFKMFYRGDARSAGSGIGLYIVRETLDKINGEISVRSDYGHGSTFTVVLQALKPSNFSKTEKKEEKLAREAYIEEQPSKEKDKRTIS